MQVIELPPGVEPLVLWEPPEGSAEEPILVDTMLTRWLRAHQREGVQFLFDCVTGLRSDIGQGEQISNSTLMLFLFTGSLSSLIQTHDTDACLLFHLSCHFASGWLTKLHIKQLPCQACLSELTTPFTLLLLQQQCWHLPCFRGWLSASE